MQVIGVTSDQMIIAIDPVTGMTTPLSDMNIRMDIADDTTMIVNVKRAADRLWFMSGTTNHRTTIDTDKVTVDGALNWNGADMIMFSKLMAMAAAYTNGFGKPAGTQVFNIDTGLSARLQHTARNDGTNMTICALCVMLGGLSHWIWAAQRTA